MIKPARGQLPQLLRRVSTHRLGFGMMCSGHSSDDRSYRGRRRIGRITLGLRRRWRLGGGGGGGGLGGGTGNSGGAPVASVVSRSQAERLASPERLNLDRRGLTACPLLQGEERLRLLNYQNNAIAEISNLHTLPYLIFLDLCAHDCLLDCLLEGPLSAH